MVAYYKKFIRRVALEIDSAPMSSLEKMRLQHFSVFLFLGVPNMLAYGLYNLWQQEYVLCGFVSLSTISLIASWFVLIKFNCGTIVYRTTNAMFFGLVSYMLIIGGEEGSKILWMYVFPLVSFFLFGKREGLFWSTLSFIFALVVIWNPFELSIVYNYSNDFFVRFLTTFLIVSAISYWFEHFRGYYREDLERKNLDLRREITERKKVEEKLRASEAQFRSWLECSPVCTKVLDRDFRLRYMSPAGVNYLKIDDIEPFYGELFPFDCYPEPQRTSIEDTLKKIVQTGEVITLETPVLDTTGALNWFLSTFMAVGCVDGDCDYLMVISVNITDRKEAEENQNNLEMQLQQSRKMEAVGTLAGGIAHDFNNILAAILGYAELVQDSVAGDVQVEKDIDNIIVASNRGTELVRQLLTFGRKSDMVETQCLPGEVVREALAMMKVTLPTSIIIESDIHTDCGVALINGTYLHQIVMNLCTNGSHSMPDEKGTLGLTLEKCTLGEADVPGDQHVQPGEFALLTVTDTGKGMDATTVARIFDPYFTTKMLGSGTGLGLSVVQGIVQQCKGFIQVESVVGRGTTIRVYLPVIEIVKDNSSSVVKKKPVVKGNNESILLVDDEVLVLKFYDKLLTRAGYKTTAFSDSTEALEVFCDNPDNFDLLLSDQTMPGLTGGDLASAVLKIKPSMPIILCTGHSLALPKEKALAMGVKEYLVKPVSMGTLLEAVGTLLATEKGSAKPQERGDI